MRLALLFGSRARGTPSTDSDVDLRRAGYPLLQALLRDAIVVHGGSRHAAARWRTRAILETETDRPWFERMSEAYLARVAQPTRRQRCFNGLLGALVGGTVG